MAKWYAVMTDRDDTDWGTGSFDRAEAEKMVVNNLDIYPDGYIAVIETNFDECVGEIEKEDFNQTFRVTYLGGPGRNINDDVDYMLVKVGPYELYAEMVNPTWNEDKERFDDEVATFEDLKAEIISQAEEKGIPLSWLNFD